MLIGLAIAIFAFLFGGPQNELLLSNMDKYAKKVIVDKDTKKLVISEVKAVNKIQKQYQKETKKQVKQLNKLVVNQNTSAQEYASFFSGVVEYNLELNNEFIPHRLTVQKSLSENEWESILEEGKKEFKKSKKVSQKRLDKFKKELAKSEEKILKSIDNTGDRDIAKIKIMEFNKGMTEAAISLLDKNPYNQQILLNKDASEANLMEVINHDIEEWSKMFEVIKTLHLELSQLVPEENWKIVSKEFKKIIKL